MSEIAHGDSCALAAVDLFLGVPDRGLDRIAALGRIRRLPRRSRIFSQGDDNVRAHAVLEGAVNLAQSGSDGAQVVMRIVGPGQSFGTVSLFTDRQYSADAVTMCETVEASWTEDDFFDLLGAYPQIAINFIRVIGSRLQETQERVRELATRSVEHRIAHTVLRLARQNGRATSSGVEISVPLRRKDVADIAGTTLHTASRVLAAWERAGLLANTKRTLMVRGMRELLAKTEG